MVTQVTSLSRNGMSDWVVQRVTAVILSVYTVVLVGFVALNPDLQFQAWRDLFSSTWMQVLTLLALLSTCAHAWIGMWTIGTDYLRPHLQGEGANSLRFVYQIGCAVILVIYLIWGIKILWGS